MSGRVGPDWCYADTPWLDSAKLIELGADRPHWTRHFTNWRAFVTRVRAAKCDGDPTSLLSAHGWYSDADLKAAESEVMCT